MRGADASETRRAGARIKLLRISPVPFIAWLQRRATRVADRRGHA